MEETETDVSDAPVTTEKPVKSKKAKIVDKASDEKSSDAEAKTSELALDNFDLDESIKSQLRKKGIEELFQIQVCYWPCT